MFNKVLDCFASLVKWMVGCVVYALIEHTSLIALCIWLIVGPHLTESATVLVATSLSILLFMFYELLYGIKRQLKNAAKGTTIVNHLTFPPEAFAHLQPAADPANEKVAVDLVNKTAPQAIVPSNHIPSEQC